MAVTPRALVIGANGQLGYDIVRALRGDGGWEVVPLTHAGIEITDPGTVASVLQAHRPDVVINTAAYHAVDRNDQAAEFFRVNAVGVKILAEATRDAGGILVHFSTDYVFDGSLGRAYHEGDAPNPVNTYGISKLAGELLIRATTPRHYILRVCGLYGVTGCRAKAGMNFVEIMLGKASRGEAIRVVTDQVVSPTYTVDVAEVLVRLLPTDRYGTYHAVNPGPCTWYEFARDIFELSGMVGAVQVLPATSAEVYSSVRRPANSALENRALRAAGLPDLRHRREALAAYLKERGTRRA
ncbi:MAG: dTDP-4-dehydrorhamnose reductase [Candidatus Rokubacteria bacterium]|nr:dTDP-4-dehydrorhamnose reductase [Candidatus Rokubacteria bacterium]